MEVERSVPASRREAQWLATHTEKFCKQPESKGEKCGIAIHTPRRRSDVVLQL
jgi:hypothetical protein